MKDVFIGCKETIDYPTSSNFRTIIQKNKYQIESHWHPWVEIILPFSYNYDVGTDSEKITLNKGDIMVLHAGTIHSLSAPEKGTRLIFQFDIEILYSLKEFQDLLFTFPALLVLKRDTNSLLYRSILNILLEITKESLHKKLLWEARLYSLVLQMYTLLFRSPEIQMHTLYTSMKSFSFKNARYQEKFFSVCQYMNQNLSDSLTLESVAAYAGFSKFHFSRLFKDFIGISFSQYLVRQRIHKAKLLLLTTNAGITDIAMESGFNSSSTFNRAFSGEAGMSPSDFRSKFARMKVPPV